ncbi:hypothetical protein CLOM_g5375 [Closterium sp. NIES-68]|nr:hypothetical protein CLOM_g5375 [Closterium sp. NIES-68]
MDAMGGAAGGAESYKALIAAVLHLPARDSDVQRLNPRTIAGLDIWCASNICTAPLSRSWAWQRGRPVSRSCRVQSSTTQRIGSS